MKTIEERFWEKVNKTDTCWLWTASIDNVGYGSFRINNHTHRAHQVSYELAFGSIPEGMFICHKCDIRNCVNPKHLFLGTMKDNSQDMVKKGRCNPPRGYRNGSYTHPEKVLKGEQVPASKLKEIQIIEIREKYKNGNTSFRKLAKEYHIASSGICRIVNNKLWKHVQVAP